MPRSLRRTVSTPARPKRKNPPDLTPRNLHAAKRVNFKQDLRHQELVRVVRQLQAHVHDLSLLVIKHEVVISHVAKPVRKRR